MTLISKAAAVALPAVLALVVTGASPATQAAAKKVPPGAAAPPAAPAFLLGSTTRDLPLTGADAVAGARRLVTLDTALLPQQGREQDLGLAVGGDQVTARVDQVEQNKDFTSWAGALTGEVGSFSLVQAAGVFRGTVTTTDGLFSISSAGGDQYWLTEVAPFPTPTATDAVTIPIPADAAGDSAGSAGPAASAGAGAALSSKAGKKGNKGNKGKKKKGKKKGKKKAGKAKVTVLFGYTKDTLVLAGGKPQLKAAAAQAVSDTNISFANSGVRAKLKYKGLVKAKGSESASQSTDFRRLYTLGDGKYDNLLKARNRKGADLVHLFLAGRDTTVCGLGALPTKPSRTNPVLSISMSALGCLPGLTPSHEIGHNLGAGHDDYPGVMGGSKVKYAHGYTDPAHGFRTVMAYVDACFAIFVDCPRIPYYSTTKVTYNGLPVGDKSHNNTKVINLVAPKVARYRR